MARITPMLWFDTEALEAATHYCSIFPNSEIRHVTHYGEPGPGEAGTVMTVDFVIDGQPVTALNGGPNVAFTEAISLVVHCANQEEVDHYWSSLVEGGEERPCGWLKDRYGVFWQVVPIAFEKLLLDPDAGRRDRAVRAMYTMNKMDIEAIQRAADRAVSPPSGGRWNAPLDPVKSGVSRFEED
jgi:predicted 3-demethylubiquinone-9 3-methyltransferase (glyoxalase superfamily)